MVSPAVLSACKKMPKELRAWDSYVELKKMVDDFLESLPLVEQLALLALVEVLVGLLAPAPHTLHVRRLALSHGKKQTQAAP